MESNINIKIANMSFGNLLSEGLKLFKRTYWKILLPLALFQIISIILKVFLLTDLVLLSYRQTEFYNYSILFLLATTLQLLIEIIFLIIAMSTVSSFVYKRYMELEVNFRSEFKKAIRNPKILIVILILGVVMGFGLSPFVFFIPGVIIFGLFIFLVYTFNLDETKESPIEFARKFAKGSFWNILFITLIYFLIIWVINVLFGVIIYSIYYFIGIDEQIYLTYLSWLETKNYGMLIFYEISNGLVSILFAPLLICMLTPLFCRCKARSELAPEYYSSIKQPYRQRPYNQEVSPSIQMVPQTPSQWTEKIQQQSGIFCPSCGYKIIYPRKFCPNCGDSLEDLNI